MCSGIPIKLLNFSDLTKFLVLNFHAKHHIFNGLDTWLLGAVNKFSKNNRSIENRYLTNNKETFLDKGICNLFRCEMCKCQCASLSGFFAMNSAQDLGALAVADEGLAVS